MDKTCHCGGNHSLRPTLGRILCECGGKLNDAQVISRIISRIEEIEEDQFKMIGALQVAGLDLCEQCGDWAKDCWTSHDRCRCPRCLEGNPEGPVYCDEMDDEETVRDLEISVVRYLAGRGLPIRSKELQEVKKRISL